VCVCVCVCMCVYMYVGMYLLIYLFIFLFKWRYLSLCTTQFLCPHPASCLWMLIKKYCIW